MIGRVIDSATGAGVAFAVVGTERNGAFPGVEADADGNWSFDFLPGELLLVERTGYHPAFITTEDLAAAGGIVQLAEAITELDPVVVTPSPDQGGNKGWLLALLALLAVSSAR